MTAAARDEVKVLHDAVMSFSEDPLGYVLFAFPWTIQGTSLVNDKGPEPWQRAVLERLGKGLTTADEAVREATASGHGIGKSALVAWIILWALSTKADTRGVVTANTEGQLRTKTWPELTKWHALSVNRGWFTCTATAIYSVLPGHDRTWRVDAITWSENNTEAIAGLHNKGKRAFAIFDEASAIPETIWETIEGALTDAGTQLFWCVFGNPTKNSGRFRECFAGGRFAHRWHNNQIDSRSVAMTNKAQIAQWVSDYGEDSDFIRVRVRGEFPRAGSLQFIDSERVEEAMQRALTRDTGLPLIMGVDIARQGEDQTVIRFRQGVDARSVPAMKFRIPDLMQVASRVAEQINIHKPAAVFVDATGIGAGVFDRLAQMGYAQVVGVNFGGKSDRTTSTDAAALYANKRAEMWGHLKDWCRTGCLPEDRDLQADLIGVEYGYDAANAILLEKKEDMRRRGLASPDDGDALALTFAYPVAARDEKLTRRTEDLYAALKRRVI